MKALVTGGAGFIGSHIVESLLSDGYKVICMDDLSAGKESNVDLFSDNSNYRFVNASVTNQLKVDYWMDGIDVVFHNAASKKNICLDNPIKDLEVNAGGTLNLLLAAKKHGVKKFVHASTGSVYGEPVEFPQTESHPLNPVSYYGVSKLAGDRYVNMFSKMGWLDTTILRYFHVYGPRQEDGEYGGVIAIFFMKAKAGEPLVIFGDGTQQRTFTHVDDIVKINRLVASRPTGGIYNCASGIKVTVKDVAYKIIELTGSNSDVVYDDWLVGDIKEFDVDNSKVRNLGINFIGIDKGLQYEVSV
jgi:nucleoside-diphosphate-sugar epimerase